MINFIFAHFDYLVEIATEKTHSDLNNDCPNLRVNKTGLYVKFYNDNTEIIRNA